MHDKTATATAAENRPHSPPGRPVLCGPGVREMSELRARLEACEGDAATYVAALARVRAVAMERLAELDDQLCQGLSAACASALRHILTLAACALDGDLDDEVLLEVRSAARRAS